MKQQSGVTGKQRRVIGFIQENLGITFTGTSMEEARAWISEHMEESKQVGAKNREVNVTLIHEMVRNAEHRARVAAVHEQRYAEQDEPAEALPRYTPDGYEIDYGFGGMVMGFLPKEPDIGSWD